MIKLGKRTLVRRRGRGGKQFRAVTVGKIAPAKYPNFRLDQSHSGIIVDIVHERGRNAPLAKIHFDDGTYSYIPAVDGATVGSKIEMGARGSIYSTEHFSIGGNSRWDVDLQYRKECWRWRQTNQIRGFIGPGICS